MRGSLPVFLARRLVALAATVVVAPTVAYVVFNGLAGRLGEPAPAAAWHYIVRTFWHFDLGTSSRFQEPIGTLIRETLPTDLAMVLGGLAFGIALGIGGGLIAAARPGTATTGCSRAPRPSCSRARPTGLGPCS